MSYFTEEQVKWLQDAGFEQIRDNAFYKSNNEIWHTIMVEALDEFRVTIEYIRGLDAVVRGTNLKKTVRSALRRYKYFAKDIIAMVEEIDKTYPDTANIPK